MATENQPGFQLEEAIAKCLGKWINGHIAVTLLSIVVAKFWLKPYGPKYEKAEFKFNLRGE